MLEKLIEAGLWLVLIGAAVVTIEAFELWQLTIIDKRIEKIELKKRIQEYKQLKQIREVKETKSVTYKCPYCGNRNKKDGSLIRNKKGQEFISCNSCGYMFNIDKW